MRKLTNLNLNGKANELKSSSSNLFKTFKRTGINQGETVAIAHGLDGDKILGALIKIRQSAGAGITADFDTSQFGTGYQFDWYHDATHFFIVNSTTNSGAVLNKSISIIVFYTP